MPLVPWTVIFQHDFDAEFDQLHPQVQDALLQVATAVKRAGPKTGRPYVDTLYGSKHCNMKEMRFKAGKGAQVWRAAFAFDPMQRAVVLVAAEKQGASEKRFYWSLIRKADDRFDRHLAALEAELDVEARSAQAKMPREGGKR